MRHVWVHDGYAHIDMRGAAGVAAEDVPRLEEAVENVAGVRWAAWNGVLERVIVACDPGIRVTDVIRAVDAVERTPLAGTKGPRDIDPRVGNAIALGGDLIGAGVGMAGRVLRTAAAPVELPALVAAAEHVPRLRKGLAARLGGVRADVGTALAGAAAAAAAQTPLGPLADATLRGVLLSEAWAHRGAWRRRAPDLHDSSTSAKADALPPRDRPAPLPDGPIERYAGQATTVTLLAAGVLVPFRSGARRAARALGIGAPRAGRAGREAYAAALGRTLARRGVVVREPAALRRLDRLDTVVVEAGVLTTGRVVIGEVVALQGTDDEARQRAELMLDGALPRQPVRRAGWTLGPLRRLDVAVPSRVTARLAGRTRTALGLVKRGRLVAVVTVQDELDPLASALAAAASKVGHVFVAGGGTDLVHRLPAEGTVAGGSRLAGSVRTLQEQGRGVLLVATRNDAALAAADCGIGVLTEGRRPPWGAHALCGPGLEPVWLVLEASSLARRVSRNSARVALIGSVAGAFLGLIGPQTSAGRRGLAPPGIAVLANVVGGFLAVSNLGRLAVPVPEDQVPWHALPVEDVLRRLHTSPAGLDEEQAAERRTGTADQTANGRRGPLQAVLDELDTPLTAPLAVGAGLSAAIGSGTDAALVLSVLAANAVLGGAQRIAAERALHRLRTAGTLKARVRRDGATRLIPAADLVPGDVVLLEAGDAIPADCRLIQAAGLEMDESSLTGESMPVPKSTEATLALAVADRTSVVYAGTNVAAGAASAVVTATGRSTQEERGAEIAEAAPASGGVEARLRALTAASVPVAAGAAATVLGIGLLRGHMRTAFDSAVALAVAAIPEGLPFVATVAQLSATRRLSDRNVLVRHARAMEALGRVDVVCFDKTGTLTEGRIELRHVSDGHRSVPIDALSSEHRLVLSTALRATPPSDGDAVLPHPTDRAVAAGGERAGVDLGEGAARWHLIRELPFEPGRGFHAVLGRYSRGQLLSVKGAPEIVLPRCVAWRRAGHATPLTDNDREQLNAEIDRLAQQGYRVLAVAERRASSRRSLDDERIERLEFLGLLGLADPVRPTAAEAVQRLRRAGVDVVMLTGDHPSTAESIAAELDIPSARGAITGPELDEADDEKLAMLVQETKVFARVSPTHKVAIIRALRSAGRVVAVTGDGANDAPAIRLADVGIALGDHGTTAARQAADMIVTDDRIETIVDAVIEGRALWASVRDAVALLVGGNLGEIAFTVGSSLLSQQPPLNARQLLFVNLVTDLLPAMALAARPPRGLTPDDLIREGPDASLGTALTCEVAQRAVATAAATGAGWLAARLTGTRRRASTVALASLISSQLAQTATASRGDPLVLAAAAASAATTIGAIQTPPISRFFGCRPLGPVAWGIVLGAAGLGAAIGMVNPCRSLDVTKAPPNGQPADTSDS